MIYLLTRITGLSLLLLAFNAQKSSGQAAKPVAACVLTGADTVNAGSIASYMLSSCTADKWTVSCGTIPDQKPAGLTVNFAVTGGNSLVITAISAGKAVATKKVIVVPAATITAGAIGSAGPAVNYGRIPPLLTAPVATGGICGNAFSYQWLSSSDNINFSPVAGAIAKDYQPGPLLATTYFKRQVNCPASVAPVMTNSATVTVYPPLSIPVLNPATQCINANTAPSPISVGPIHGGVGSFTYQWQSSANTAFSAPMLMTGATSASFTPGNLNATTYFRVAVVNYGDTFYSAPAVVSVFPELNAGSVTPVSQTVAYDSVPALLSSTAVAGGTGIYRYQWYSSVDNSNWTSLAGVSTSNYNPGGLEVTTWFRVLVTSNGLPATSTAAVVYVSPKNQ